jgi:transducin (beta)-like 1
LRAESKLETSPNYTKHVRRGELVDLLSKALLYVEVEAHWSKDAVTTSCQTPFTLLDEHRCSADAKQTEIPVADTLSKELTAAEAQPKRVVASNTDANKRKAPERLESDAEKRARTTESTSVTVQTNGSA